MKVELHIIQNLAPSCLNRDDTNTPKDCDFGGVRRARVSSQSWKRAMRERFFYEADVPLAQGAVRTRHLVSEVMARLEGLGHPVDEAERAAIAALAAGGLGVDERTLTTQYLLFLPLSAVGDLAGLLHEHWDDLASVRAATALPRKGTALDAPLTTAVRDILGSSGASPEIALFGRMIADNRDWNVDAACQVAHAISTHASTTEFDFFTAMDDLLPRGAGGAGMLGATGFNAACFYRYLLVDLDQLATNLGGDADAGAPERPPLTARTLEALVRVAVTAIPSGRQNAMAAHNLPSFVLAVVRDGGAPISLANAFVKPIAPRLHGGHDDLVEGSIIALDRHFADVTTMFGRRAIRLAAWCALQGATRRPLHFLGGGPDRDPETDFVEQVASVDELVMAITRAVAA